MALETYRELVEQVRADAFDFATTMRACERVSEYVAEEFSGRYPNFPDLVGVWVLGRTTKYDGSPLEGGCSYLRNEISNRSYVTEARHAGLSLDAAFRSMAADRQLEQRAIAIRADDGDLTIVTDHTHAPWGQSRRAGRGGYHPSSYLGREAFYDDPRNVEAAYNEWRADLAVIPNQPVHSLEKTRLHLLGAH